MSSSLAGRATLLLAAVSLCVLVAGCDRESRTTTRLGTRNNVTVIDRTGWFESVRVARSELALPRDLDGASIEVRDTEWPRILLLRWAGGRCHIDTTTIELARAGGRIRLTLWAGPPCANQAWAAHWLELVFDRPVPADTVDAEIIERDWIEPVASATP